VNATDLDILEGWIEEVELEAQKLTAEISKLRPFIEKVKEVGENEDIHIVG
jgi:hypothetical protein